MFRVGEGALKPRNAEAALGKAAGLTLRTWRCKAEVFPGGPPVLAAGDEEADVPDGAWKGHTAPS